MPAELVDATDLDRLSDRLEMRGLLPHLVRRLIGAAPGTKDLDMPAEEGISAHGFDGVIDGGTGSRWVPAGPSVWEIGAGQDPLAKAQKDYKTRTAKPDGAVPADTAFVFVTSRRADGRKWAHDRAAEGDWREVRTIDAEGLYAWLEATPDVHIWLSERLGFQPLSVRTLSRAYETITARTRPALPGGLLLAGREQQAQALREALAGPPGIIPVRGGSREEAVAFIAAALGLDGLDGDRAPGQPLQVRDAQALERLALAERPMQLVVAIDGCEVADAAAHGHHVMLALGSGDYDTSGQIALPRPAPQAASDALRNAGVPFERSERLAKLAGRSFAALQRELAITPAGARPPWATGAEAPLLAALMLLGSWTPIAGDDDVLQSVVNQSRAEVEKHLLALVTNDDPPWTRSGGTWRVVSADDAFALVGELLNDELLARWCSAAEEVLCEVNPRDAMNMGERMLAEARSEALPRYSAALRLGVAEAVALLGARGEQLPTGAVPAEYAQRLVINVLNRANADLSGDLWRCLGDVIPMLAEAAPDAFLDAIGDGLESESSPVAALLTEGQSDAFTPPPYTGLLWALERIAWSPEHLVRVTLILGELAQREQSGGQWTNRPSSTLRTIFLAWLPNTDADLAGRLRALDALRTRQPTVAWKLLLAMLPHSQTVGTYSAKPRFRDWGLECEPVPTEELIATIHEVISRIVADAAASGERWESVVPLICSLPPTDRSGLLDQIATLDAQAMVPEERLVLWRALVEEGERNLRFPDAHWSLDREEAERYITLAERFEDPDSPERHARIFDSRVHLVGVEDDFEAQQRALGERRDEIAAEVFARSGCDGLLRLSAASEHPRLVGIAAGALGDAPARQLLALIGGEGPGAAMAAGWAARRIREQDASWAVRQLESTQLSPDGQTALLLEMPDGEATWDLSETLDNDVQTQYWRTVKPLGVPVELLGRLVERLLQAGRPWVAIDMLASVVHRGDQPDTEMIERVLFEAARSDEVDAAVQASWELGELLDALEAVARPALSLARLEFIYLRLLNNVRPPRMLTRTIAAEPELFVELVRHACSRSDGAEEPDARPEMSAQAWQVLSEASRVPGQREDRLIDHEQLEIWVAEARTRLAAVDRTLAGDIKIGELLSRAPCGEDGIWPAEPIRDLLEKLRCQALEEGLRDGRLNQRGVTSRDAYEGGEQERRLAAGLRRGSQQLEVNWPRTARLIRGMAEWYEADARRQDRFAQRRADGV